MVNRLLKILTLVSVLAFGCADIEETSQSTESERFPNSVLEKASVTLTTEGRKEAIIFADTLFVFDREDSTVAVNVKVDFFDEEGNYKSTLTSEDGLVRQERQRFSVWGDVVVKNDTTRLETESLEWDPDSRLITTDDFVKVTRGKDIVTGYGMEADSRLENIRILKDVQGTFSDVPRNEDDLNRLEGEPEPEEIP